MTPLSARHRAVPFARIPVADELPDDDTTVLIALDDGETWTGYLDAGQWHYVSGDEMAAKVEFWAHVPPHPRTA